MATDKTFPAEENRPMTNDELAHELHRIVSTAPEGIITLSYHLFGLKYAKELSDPGISVARVLTVSKLPKSYQMEINKGKNLAAFVTLNEEGLWF